MRKLDLLTEFYNVDTNIVTKLQAISDDLVRSFQNRINSQNCNLMEKISKIEKLRECADDYICYWFFIVKKYRKVFLINEKETKSNLFLKDLESIGITDIDVSSLLKRAIKAEYVSYVYFNK